MFFLHKSLAWRLRAVRFSARLYAVHFLYKGLFEMSFAENFRAARKEHKLTQKQIAEVLNIDRSAIAHYEMGTALPNAKNIPKICEILEIPIEKLFL